MKPPGKIDPLIRELLDASGRSWTLEHGSNHQKLRVEGVFIASLPRTFKTKGGGARQALNAVAAVKRHLKGLE